MSKWVTHMYIDGEFTLELDHNMIYGFNYKLEIESIQGRIVIELEKIEYDSHKFITQYFFKSLTAWKQKPSPSKDLSTKWKRLYNEFTGSKRNFK